MGRLNLLAAIAAISVLGFAMGLSYPLLSLQLDARHYSSAMIGVSAASQPLGTISSLFAIPWLTRRFGTKRVAVMSAILTSAILATYPIFSNFWIWCALRFGQGFLFSILFVISESWVVEFSRGAYRTRIVSLYMSAFAAAMALGPVLITVVGSVGWLPFLTGAAVLLAVTVPIAMINGGEIAHTSTGLPVLNIISRNPVLVCAVAVFALTEITSLSLLPVYAKALGQTENRSTLLVSIFVGGPIVLQYPFAWLGDHFTKRNVLIASAAFSYLAYILLPIAVDTFVVWILLAFLGAATACLYTLSLARLGEKYRGNDLVAGTAVFSAVYGFGSLIGSSTTGTVMSVLGAASFPYVLGAILVVLIIVAAVASEF